ncbi:MAG TPA: hypothetical protein VIG24_03045 [Acidimicrobiia bacterium]
MLKKNLNHLDTPSGKPEGLLPDASSEYVTVLVEELAQMPPKPQVSDTLTRHSAAGSCLKRIALVRDGVQPEPMDMAGHHVTHIGTLMHDAWQAALKRKYEGAIDFETGSTIEDLTSGSCDAVLYDDMGVAREVLELKTVGEFAYDLAVGLKGPAQGPKPDHLTQLALNVRGHDAYAGTIIYLRRSSVSQGVADSKGIEETLRIGAQWTIPRDTLDPIADEWLAQLEYVRDHDTKDVPRFVPNVTPKGARLDPTTGTWTLKDGEGNIIDTGTFWNKGAGCLHYCATRDACVERFMESE